MSLAATVSLLLDVDVNPVLPDGAFMEQKQAAIELMFKAWLHEMSETDLECLDPNTGEVVGVFRFSPESYQVTVHAIQARG